MRAVRRPAISPAAGGKSPVVAAGEGRATSEVESLLDGTQQGEDPVLLPVEFVPKRAHVLGSLRLCAKALVQVFHALAAG